MVELLITLVVAAILTSTGLPLFREFITNQRIKSASFDLMSTLNRTRSEAIRRNANATITPVNNNWANGWTVTTDFPAAGTVILNQAAMKSLTVTCVPGPACASITYNSNGRSSATQSIQVSSAAITYPKLTCISVDLSGMPKSKKASC